MQEARQGHRRPRRHRRAVRREVHRDSSERPAAASPASAPARRRARSSSSSIKPSVAEEVKPRGADGEPRATRRGAGHRPAQPAGPRPGRPSSIPEDGPFVYEFEVEVRPEFDLPDYKGLKLRRPVHTFTDADVEAEKQRLLEPYGQVVPKEGNAGQVEPTTSSSATVVTIGSAARSSTRLNEVGVRVEKQLALTDGVAEDFGKKMAGRRPATTREVDVKLGEEVGRPRRSAGKTVQGRFTVKDVKTVRLPELTRELLERSSASSTEGQLDELIASVAGAAAGVHAAAGRPPAGARANRPRRRSGSCRRTCSSARPARRCRGGSWRCGTAGMSEQQIEAPLPAAASRTCCRARRSR